MLTKKALQLLSSHVRANDIKVALWPGAENSRESELSW